MTINQNPFIHELVICANVFIKKGGLILMIKRSAQKKFAPNFIHPIGGKVELNENPYTAAEREVMEEAELKVKNMRLEAVLLEITPHKDMLQNWLIFHFSADWESGKLSKTDEGEFIWLKPEEIPNQDLFPSVKQVIDKILNPHDDTVFATFSYDGKGNLVKSDKKIESCVV
jgi:8-oxo-dGTP pyrophosphatase MutT (NUDIX family)